jgi:hypothetical protein
LDTSRAQRSFPEYDWFVRREADRGVVLTDALRLQLEAATLRLVLMRLHMRLGNVTRAGALAQEGHAVL